MYRLSHKMYKLSGKNTFPHNIQTYLLNVQAFP